MVFRADVAHFSRFGFVVLRRAHDAAAAEEAALKF